MSRAEVPMVEAWRYEAILKDAKDLNRSAVANGNRVKELETVLRDVQKVLDADAEGHSYNSLDIIRRLVTTASESEWRGADSPPEGDA